MEANLQSEFIMLDDVMDIEFTFRNIVYLCLGEFFINCLKSGHVHPLPVQVII